VGGESQGYLPSARYVSTVKQGFWYDKRLVVLTTYPHSQLNVLPHGSGEPSKVTFF
jgi:hypothetical protein